MRSHGQTPATKIHSRSGAHLFWAYRFHGLKFHWSTCSTHNDLDYLRDRLRNPHSLRRPLQWDQHLAMRVLQVRHKLLRIKGEIHWMNWWGCSVQLFLRRICFHGSPRKLDETLAYQASKVIPALFGLHHVHQPPNGRKFASWNPRSWIFFHGKNDINITWLETAHARKAGEKTPVCSKLAISCVKATQRKSPYLNCIPLTGISANPTGTHVREI